MKEAEVRVKFARGCAAECIADEVEVGATGLYLVKQLQSNEWQMHFFPEGNKTAVKGKERLFALMFLSGFYSLVNWWFSPENPYAGDTMLHFCTNERQLHFMEKNLGPEAVSVDEENREANMYQGRIALDAVQRSGAAMDNIGSAYRIYTGQK